MMKFLAGVGVGFGVGLMLAPENGSATRKKIVEKFDRAADHLHELSEPLISAVGEQVGRFVDVAKESVQHSPIHETLRDEGERVLQILNSASKTKLMSVSGIGDATQRFALQLRLRSGFWKRLRVCVLKDCWRHADWIGVQMSLAG